jgi:hypothetical protein
MKILNSTILFIVVFMCVYVHAHGQILSDYVVLKSSSNSQKIDTLYGQVDLPNNGVFWNVQINTPSGKRKFKTKEVASLKAGYLYFASIPYGKSFAIVPRILSGEIELYFYYTGSDRLSFIPQMQEELNRDISYDDHLLLSESIWNATSNFYIFDKSKNKYFKVPRSIDKFKEQIAEIFKANQDIYNKIMSEEYRPNQIGLVIKRYNYLRKM